MNARPTPNRELMQLAREIEAAALLTTVALEHINDELLGTAGWPSQTMGDGQPSARSTQSIVERHIQIADDLHSTRDQIRDDVTGLTQMVRDYMAMLRRVGGVRLPKVEPPAICDGSNLRGATMRWVPHSRDPGNGWYDEHCVDAGDPVLCPKCAIRWRRWLTERGHTVPAVSELTPCAKLYPERV